MTGPVDHVVRTRATTALDRSIALSAGAGSGKTSVLAARIVNLVASGANPSRIAAITFTEKAAGELESRVRDALEERFRLEPTDTLAEGLRRFHELTLSTIHGFCRTLLSREPLSARWAPGTEIDDGELQGIGPALSAWRRETSERAPRTLALFDATLKDGAIRGVVETLLENRDLAPVLAEAPLASDEDWADAHAQLVAVRDAIEAAAARCRNPACKLLENNADFRARLSRWCARSVDGALEALVSTDVGGRQGGRAGDWPGGKEAFKEALDGIELWRAEIYARAHGELVRSLGGVAEEVLRARRAEAQADYADLLFRAAALLGDPAVRARLSSRFDALLIDEVQDTDPVQAEVAALLTSPPTHTGPWRAGAPEPGKLFAVGDPKQSIYRFRRADVEIWRDLQAVVARGGHADELTQNFRSVPGVVGWVNHVFREMPTFSPQVAHRAVGALDPVVVLFGDPGAASLSAEDEAELVLRHLLDARRGGGTVLDPATGTMRPLAWGDVMLLVPKWAHTTAIARTFLRAGVPCVVDGGGTFFKDPAVTAAFAALRAVDEPAAHDATAAVLEGLFGLTLEDLARHVAGGGSLRFTVETQPPGPVADALGVLRAARRAFSGGWVPVLDELLASTRAPAAWSLLSEGPAHLANLDKLRALLRKLEDTSRSPTAVIEELVRLSREADESELSRLDPDTDAVRLTTVFSAKGLEAPVVVLLDMARKHHGLSAIVDRASSGLFLRSGRFVPPGWDDAEEAEKVALDEERRRWMYVASTRARDQLVVVAAPKANLLAHLAGGWSAASPDGERRETIAEGVIVTARRADLLPAPDWIGDVFGARQPLVEECLAAPPGRGDPTGEARAAETREAIRRSARAVPRWRSVGELAIGRRAALDAVGTGNVGVRGGTVVHRAMEHLDLTQAADVLLREGAALARRLAGEAGLSAELTDRVELVVKDLVRHPVIAEIRAAREHWKEVPFAFHERGTVIAGTIDLAFPEDDARTSWVVVDWKSDLPPVGHPLRERYDRQLATYAKALLRTVAPCERVRTVLVGPHASLPTPSDADLALELVAPPLRPMLESLLGAGAPAPRVGADLGEPVIAQVELVWDDAKVAVCIDNTEAERTALEHAGYRVAAIDAAAASDLADALRALGGWLGVRPVGENEENAGAGDADSNGDA